jgi:hypothetical protein
MADIQRTARPHQLTGARFLADHTFAMLADEAGAGKTATLVMACDHVGAERVLVFCPAVVRNHWAKEFTVWQTMHRPITVVETIPTRAPGPGVTIYSHASLVKPEHHARLWHAGPYDAIIPDEGHEFRQFDAARTRNMYGFAPFGLWTRARHLWHATATPVVNSAADMYPLFAGPLSGRTLLGAPGWYEFAKRFTDLRPDTFKGDKPVGVRDAESLRMLLREWVIRRDIDLHIPLTIQTVPLDVDDAAMVQMQGELAKWTPEQIRAVLEAGGEPQDESISRLRKLLGLAKVDAAARELDRVLMSGAGPVVAFFHHTEVRERLFAALKPRWRVSWIDGKITRDQLRAAESWFQAGRLDLLLVQTQAGGMGLTLTRASVAAVVELPWTSTALWQAIKRVHRLTQTRACWAALFRSDTWLEDVMLSVIQRKSSMSSEIFDPLTEHV